MISFWISVVPPKYDAFVKWLVFQDRWRSWHRWSALCLLADIYLSGRRRRLPPR